MRASSPSSVAFVLAACAIASSASAQEAPQSELRRSLITEAQQAADAGQHARALELAARAADIQMTPSLQLFIAQEQEAVGQLAPALRNAEACARDAERDLALRNRDDILAECRAVVASVQPQVGYVVLRLDPRTPGAVVTVSGQRAAASVEGAAFAVAPGTVEVEATAPGRARFLRVVQVARGARVDVEVAPAPLVVDRSRDAAPVSDEGGAAPTRDRAPAAGIEPRDLLAPGPLAVVGAGVAALGASAVLFVLRDQAAAGCAIEGRELVCGTRDQLMRAEGAPGLHAAASVAAGVGVAAVVAGGAWMFLHARGESRRRAASVAVAPARDGLYGSLRWTF